jgi:sugar/nucleoside kinase (ribokinase family)
VEVIDIIVSGHLCLDIIPRMAHVPLGALAAPGRLTEVGAVDFATGGAVSNTGLALNRLGSNVRLLATVGDDFIGQAILSILNAHDPSLTQGITVQTGQPGSYTIILSPERVDRIFLHCTGTNAVFDTDHVDLSVVEQARLFHLGYPPLLPCLLADEGAPLAALYQRVKSLGVVTSMDMTLPDANSASGRVNWRAALRGVLPYTDIFIPSIEEILFMLRRDDYMAWRDSGVMNHLSAADLRHLANELLEMGVAIAGFKLGALGFYIQTGSAARLKTLGHRLDLDADAWANQSVYEPAFEVDVIGTTGAGDSAYAGFLAALLRGASPTAAARWACAVGACNVEAADATSGIRSWTETQARLESGWPQRTERFKGL